MASRLITALADVKMYQNDIDKVITYVNEISRRASLVGVFFSERDSTFWLRKTAGWRVRQRVRDECKHPMSSRITH